MDGALCALVTETFVLVNGFMIGGTDWVNTNMQLEQCRSSSGAIESGMVTENISMDMEHHYIRPFKNYKMDCRTPFGRKDGEKVKEQTRFKFDAFFCHNNGNDEDGKDNHEIVMIICQKLEEIG